MNNKILVILLSLTLSYAANANNENVQDTETIDYNRTQLREQIARAWQNISSATVLNQDTSHPQVPIPPVPLCTTRCLNATSNPCNCKRLEKKSHQDKYIVISFTPIGVNNTPYTESNIFDFANIKGEMALKTELLQDIEFGLGLKRGALRFEGGLKWTRAHVDGYSIDDVDFSDSLYYFDQFFQYDILRDYLEYLSRQTIDVLGPVGGVAYDIGRFYIGGKVGLVRASMDHMLGEVNDWTPLYQVDFGVIKEITDNLDLQAGYQYSIINETGFIENDFAATSVAPYKRHAVRFSLLVSLGE